jgi:hypothetical protein
MGPGDQVWIVGAPGGQVAMVGPAWIEKIAVTNLQNTCDKQDVVGSANAQRLFLGPNGVVYYGNSGGGAFDGQARLIGVVTELASVSLGGCKSTQPGHVLWGWAVGPVPLQEFLRAHGFVV